MKFLITLIVMSMLTIDASGAFPRNEGTPQSGTSCRKAKPSDPEKDLEALPIGTILKSPNNFVNREVLIEGEFLGWTAEVKHPLVTRSDWALRDKTGTIYVSGKSPGNLDPYRDVGHPVQVLGIVRITHQDIVYIEAKDVVVHQ